MLVGMRQTAGGAMVEQGVIAAAGLLALWYWALFAARPGGQTSWPASLVKTGATGLLALGVWLGGAPGWLVFGLGLGALGDFALSRPGERWFLAGMAAFAAGHLVYAGWIAGRALQVGGFDISALSIGGLICLLALLLSTEVWLAPFTGALRWPVRVYVLVIGAMAATIVVLPSNGAATTAIRLGAALFVLSDVVLAIRLFRAHGPGFDRPLGAAVWPLYWLGQAAIGLGGAFYAVLSKG